MSNSVISVAAVTENLPQILEFIEAQLQKYDCNAKTITELELAVEEIFTNISSYAYAPEIGNAEISVDISESVPEVIISFGDNGKKFNPLEIPDPNLTLSAEEREMGGLGIYLVKKYMDNVSYQYKNNKNILVIRKRLK